MAAHLRVRRPPPADVSAWPTRATAQRSMSDNGWRYGGLDIAVDGESDPRSLAHLLGAVIPGEDVPVPPDGHADSD
eukprot:5063691-Heterocapsa_arctica.AAC.1